MPEDRMDLMPSMLRLYFTLRFILRQSTENVENFVCRNGGHDNESTVCISLKKVPRLRFHFYCYYF